LFSFVNGEFPPPVSSFFPPSAKVTGHPGPFRETSTSHYVLFPTPLMFLPTDCDRFLEISVPVTLKLSPSPPFFGPRYRLFHSFPLSSFFPVWSIIVRLFYISLPYTLFALTSFPSISYPNSLSRSTLPLPLLFARGALIYFFIPSRSVWLSPTLSALEAIGPADAVPGLLMCFF